MPWLTELRIIVGTAALVAVVAVLALAVGTMMRRSAAAVTVVIVVIVLPYFLAISPVLPDSAADWMLRITPAAAFAVQQALPGYAQVDAIYSPGPGGYFPLAPWAGLPCCAAGPRSPWPSPSSCCGGGTHELRSAARGVDQARTIASTGWLLLAAIALTVAVGAAAAAATGCPSGTVCQVDPAKVSLTGIDLGQAVVAIAAVLAISNEYSTGMIRITLSADAAAHRRPGGQGRHPRPLALAAGTIAVLASVLAGRLILSGHGFTPAHGYELLSPGSPSVLRAAAGSVLYLVLIALLSLGVATAVRDSAVAIGIVLGLLYLFPIIANVVGDAQWQRHLEQIGPMTAGLAIQATTDLSSLPISPWAGLGVLAAWSAAALVAGGLVLGLRDA